MKVLLTNDDGIDAEGLQELRRALLRVRDIELVVIAPDGNRSAMARSITTRRPLWVEQVDFGDGTHGFATDGTPVDCVRLATLGLVEGFEAELIVSGINHGTNLGDEGFCEDCGRAQPSGRDRMECDLELVVGVSDKGHRRARNEDSMAYGTVLGADAPPTSMGRSATVTWS